jgi:CheY-like chemotaxis protein
MAKILLVDDEPQIRKLITEALEASGHNVTAASTGLEALGHVFSKSFDLALLDIAIPQIDGLGLLDTIKKQKASTMVIIISGQGSRDTAIEALKKGAFDYLKKPVSLTELENATNRALEESRLMKSSGYIYKDSDRNDKSLLKRGALLAAIDSLVAGLAFYLGFALITDIAGQKGPAYFIAPYELLFMSLGLAFSYAFVFVYRRGYRTDLLTNRRETAFHLLGNITLAYVMELSILFLIKDANFPASHLALAIGITLGYLWILMERFIISFGVISKSITFVGSRESASDYARKATDTALFHRDIDELHLSSLSPDEIFGKVDRFGGKKLKVVVHDSQGEPATKKEPVIH